MGLEFEIAWSEIWISARRAVSRGAFQQCQVLRVSAAEGKLVAHRMTLVLSLEASPLRLVQCTWCLPEVLRVPLLPAPFLQRLHSIS